MSRRALVIALALLVPSNARPSPSPPERSVQTNLSGSEYISSSWISDNGEVFLVIADDDQDSSRIIHSASEGFVSQFALRDFRANRFGRLDNGSSHGGMNEGVTLALLCGAFVDDGNRGFSCRVCRLGDGSVEVVWDSETLPFAGEAGGSASIKTTDDGSYWGVVYPVSDSELAVKIGPIPSYSAEISAILTSTWANGSPPDSVDVDRHDFVFIEDGPRGPLVAVVWQGIVYVLGAGEPTIKAIAQTESLDAIQVYWQQQGRRLWVEKPSGYESYKVPANVNQTDRTLRLSAHSRVERISGYYEKFTPLSDGRIAIFGGAKGATKTLKIFADTNGAWHTAGETPVDAPQTVQVSPSAKTVLVFPDGDTSQSVEIVRRRGNSP